MKRLLFALAVAFVVRPAHAQTTTLERELFAARDTVWRAWLHNDTAQLRRFIPSAAATLEGGSAPHWNTRGEIMAGSRAFVESNARLVDVVFRNTHISREGASALVQSNYAVIVESNGKRDTTRGRATELFVKQGETWVNPYWHLDQGAGIGREIAMPDTMGANFAIGDSANKAGTVGDYDALVGTWEFRFQSRNGDGTFFPAFSGHWTFDKKPGGGLVEDRWRPDNPAVPTGSSLYTYRVFDPERSVWQMIGASSNGGAIQPGLTWSDATGTSRYAIQRSKGILVRIRYLSIGPDGFLWRSDRSSDGGKTWLRDAGTMEAWRIGK